MQAGLPAAGIVEPRVAFRQRLIVTSDIPQRSAEAGVSHLMARDPDGTWTEVTDPVIMAKVLNSGETFYRIYARNPDVKALKDIFDRVFGTPNQQVDMTLHGELDLVARLARARQRGRDRTP